MTKRESEESLRLIRHHLGSMDLSDVEGEDASEDGRRAYCAAIHAVYPRLEKDVRRFLYAQLMFNAKEAQTFEQVIFGRGSFDGMAQLLEHWRLADMEHRGANAKESFEESNPLPEI